jgi:acetolactate synthase I/II/III large subunit
VNGAESLVATLIAGGVEVCFANPGTSEMHIVAALDRITGVRSILGLFEGVATAAADGYARMGEKPACTLLHLGPGLANGLANLHNAYRARVPLINIVGQHPTEHLRYDPPLASDVEGIAKPYSEWLRTCAHPSQVGCDTVEAIISARTPPGRISTLILPSDVAWTDGGIPQELPPLPSAPLPDATAIDRAVSMLRTGLRTALLISGNGLYGNGLVAAGRIATATGAKLLAPYPFTRLERGTGAPPVERIHYILEQAREQLKEFRQLILVGTQPPVTYFAYPGKSATLTAPGCDIHVLANPSEDCAAVLELVADALKARMAAEPENAEKPSMPRGAVTLTGIAAAVGAVLTEGTIVVDESMTSGRGLMASTAAAPRHDWLANTGGSIGIALPLAVGAAIACSDRPVLCLSADGSGMYTVQALWTMARESLKITTVMFANGVYGVLKREFSGLGIGEPGPSARGLFEIGRPDISWTLIARSMGVPAVCVTSLDDFAKALRGGLESDGPTLIEVKV